MNMFGDLLTESYDPVIFDESVVSISDEIISLVFGLFVVGGIVGGMVY